MITFTRLQGARGLRGKPAHAAVADTLATLFSISPPAPTANPPGFNPGSIATQPTVTVVQTPTAPTPEASPPMTPGAVETPWSPTADVPTTTMYPAAPKKAWVPWAIGGGVVAAVGAAIVVALTHR